MVVALAATGIGVIAASRPGPRHLPRRQSPDAVDHSVAVRARTTGTPNWTWVSDDHGWALVRTACGSSACVTLRETVDGGDTWTSLPVPMGSMCASVRFATAKVGWMFGPELWQTADGGRTWKRVASATVVDVEASHGVAMRTHPHRPDLRRRV